MNEEKELFLPDTTVKLGTLRRVLNDIYGLDIIKLKMTQTDIMHFEGLHLYETENGYGIDNRGLVYEYKPKDKASLQEAKKHFERVKNLIMKSRYAKGSTIRASNSPVLEFVNFEDNWHINLLKLNPNRNQNGLLYKGGNKYAVIRSSNKGKQEIFEFKTLEQAEDKFDKLVTQSTTYSPIRNQGKIEGNYADGGGVGGTFDSSSTGEVIGGTYGSSESGEMIGGTMASSEYRNGGGVGDEISIATKYGKMLNEISKEKQFNKKIELNAKLNQFAKQNEISIDNNNIIYIKGNKVAYIDTLNSKTGQSKINWVIKEYANGGGIGGTSDSAEMDAPTLGGTMSSSMFEGDTYSNRFENKLWNEMANGTPHSFKKGGKVSDCGCKEKYDEGGNAECGCWHYDIGGL